MFWGKKTKNKQFVIFEPLASHIFGNLTSAYRLKNTLGGSSPPKDTREHWHTHTLASLTDNSQDVFTNPRVDLTKEAQVVFHLIYHYCKAEFCEKGSWLSWKLSHSAKDLHGKINCIFCNPFWIEMWHGHVRFTHSFGSDEQRLLNICMKRSQTHSPYHTRLNRCWGLLTIHWSDADRRCGAS